MSAIVEKTNRDGYYLIWCPGCRELHQFTVPPWGFNGDYDRPTVDGSILVRYGADRRCHSFVREGRWEFLPDCTHELAGQTVAGVPFREAMEANR